MGNLILPLEALYGSIRSDLGQVERIFDAELVSDLDCVNELAQRVRGYRGKMIRPALLLFAGRAAGGVNREHHVLAAVVEMVHMATLVHDDVLDNADERRSQATVNAVSGNVAAVLLGDYLISHAFHLCSSLNDQQASRLIGSTTNTVCEGELLQNHLRGQPFISETQYFQIIRRKTASLTSVSCRLGGLFAGASREVCDALAGCGEAAGIAFQIIDDVLDVAGREEVVGKSLGLDVGLGKTTLPTIHCLSEGDEEVAGALSAMIAEGGSGNGELRLMLEETGSIDYAVSAARRYVADAIEHLSAVPDGDARDALVALAEFITDRNA